MREPNTPTWKAENAGPRHHEAVRALFQAVFGQPMSEAHWHWKYGEGRGLGVVVLGDGELVAFFGGTERRVRFNGRPLVAMQCGDSMVLPSQRGILTRKGPFYLSVTAFLGQYVGTGRPYLLTYGFPNARAMRLAQALRLYDDVGALLEVDWQPLSDFRATRCRWTLVIPATASWSMACGGRWRPASGTGPSASAMPPTSATASTTTRPWTTASTWCPRPGRTAPWGCW